MVSNYPTQVYPSFYDQVPNMEISPKDGLGSLNFISEE